MKSKTTKAFTLVEILAVIAIVAILIGLMIPAGKGIMGSSGRKGAVSQLMGAFEQARVAALESGVPVYFVLWGRTNTEPDAYIILRDRMESEPETPEFVYLTGWKTLPKSIIFNGGSIRTAGLPTGFSPTLPQSPTAAQLSAIKINETGIIEFPVAAPLELIIAEGTRSGSGAGTVQLTNEANTDTLTFSKLTGRISLKIPVANP